MMTLLTLSLLELLFRLLSISLQLITRHWDWSFYVTFGSWGLVRIDFGLKL